MGITKTRIGLRPCMPGQRVTACVAVGLVLLLFACGAPADEQARASGARDPGAAGMATHDPEPTRQKPAGENNQLVGNRAYLQGSWDTVWTRSGSLSDTVLLQPLLLLAFDSTVYVAEYGNMVVLALDAATGSVRWTAGRRGSGPREFMRPVLFRALDGMLAVADAPNQRISTVRADGSFASEARVELPSSVRSACQLSADVLLAGAVGRHSALLRFSPQDSSPRKVQAPWLADLDQLPTVLGQFHLTQVSPSLCAFVPLLGPSDLRVFDEQMQVVARVPARERLSPATADTQVLAGGVIRTTIGRDAVFGWADVAIVGESAFVVFEGSSKERLRLIDEFSLPDFAYVGTHLAPYRIKAATGFAQSLTLLMEDEEGYPRITQLRRRSATRTTR